MDSSALAHIPTVSKGEPTGDPRYHIGFHKDGTWDGVSSQQSEDTVLVVAREGNGP